MRHLAIVIPYYKLTFFRKTIESLAAQTDQRFTVYIGNDASPENPEYLLKKFDGKFKYIYKKFEGNVGGSSLTKQWERCIAMVKEEEWFMILGDDDYLSDNVVKEFHSRIGKVREYYNVIRFSLQLVNEESLSTSVIYTNPPLEDPFQAHFKKMSGEVKGSLSEYIFRKDAYLKFGFKNYDLAWGSDNRAVIDFSMKKPIYSINNACVYFRISNKSITGSGHSNIKNRSLAKQRRELFSDYRRELDKTQKLKLLKEYENVLFSCGGISIGYYFDLLIWSMMYRTKKENINLLKSLIAKLLRL